MNNMLREELNGLKQAHDDYVEFIERGRRILNSLEGYLNEKRGHGNRRPQRAEVPNIRTLHARRQRRA